MTTTELEVRRSSAVAVQDELTIEQLTDQVQLIQQAMQKVMKRGEHYGTIPGAGSKQVLFKAGAEKLCLLFRLDPEYKVVERYDEDTDHYTARVTCELNHITSGNRMGSGMGLCTTKEKKYAYRNSAVNTNLPDTYNTVLKMACKRALVAAVLNATAASDIFTQDLEDAQEQVPKDVATDATLVDLNKALGKVAYASELWAPDVVLANASRRFGRQITRLADLSQLEAEAIIKGAQQYLKDNPKPKPAAKAVATEEAQATAEDGTLDAGAMLAAAQAAQAKLGGYENPAETVDGEAVELPDDGIDWPGEAPA
jgi:hypothetical protein